jgi:hypothetical protein
MELGARNARDIGRGQLGFSWDQGQGREVERERESAQSCEVRASERAEVRWAMWRGGPRGIPILLLPNCCLPACLVAMPN